MHRILNDFHIHSCWSFDSQTPVTDIVERGTALGLNTIAICDHCFILQRDIKALLGRWEETSFIECKCPVVLYGVELSVEVPAIMKSLRADIFSFLDVIIGGVHGLPEYGLYVESDNNGFFSPYIYKFLEVSKVVGVKNIINSYVNLTNAAISTGKLNILVHLWDLFLYAGVAEPYMLELSVKLARLARINNVCIEINNDIFPTIKKCCPAEFYDKTVRFYSSFAEICLSEGVTLVPGSDAHQLQDTGRYDYVLDIFDDKILAALSQNQNILSKGIILS